MYTNSLTMQKEKNIHRNKNGTHLPTASNIERDT